MMKQIITLLGGRAIAAIIASVMAIGGITGLWLTIKHHIASKVLDAYRADQMRAESNARIRMIKRNSEINRRAMSRTMELIKQGIIIERLAKEAMDELDRSGDSKATNDRINEIR